MDQTRNNHRAHLQPQKSAQRQVLEEADRQRNSRKRSNMRGTLSLHRHEDTRIIFHTTLENSGSITEKTTGLNSTGKDNFNGIRHHVKASTTPASTPTSTSTSTSASTSTSTRASAPASASSSSTAQSMRLLRCDLFCQSFWCIQEHH